MQVSQGSYIFKVVWGKQFNTKCMQNVNMIAWPSAPCIFFHIPDWIEYIDFHKELYHFS